MVGEGKRRGEHWVEFTLFLLLALEQLSLYPFGIVDFEERLPRPKWVENHYTRPMVTSLLELWLAVVELEKGFE